MQRVCQTVEQRIGSEEIVRVQTAHEIGLRCPDGHVARGGGADALGAKYARAARVSEVSRTVRRPVVHDDGDGSGIVLRGNRVQCLSQIQAPVVDGRDDGEGRQNRHACARIIRGARDESRQGFP